jgi:hypothetical protein
MSFTVTKRDGAGLQSMGAKLGHLDSVAMMEGSAVEMAGSAIQHGALFPVAIESPRIEATVQSGMQLKTPKGPR